MNKRAKYTVHLDRVLLGDSDKDHYAFRVEARSGRTAAQGTFVLSGKVSLQIKFEATEFSGQLGENVMVIQRLVAEAFLDWLEKEPRGFVSSAWAWQSDVERKRTILPSEAMGKIAEESVAYLQNLEGQRSHLIRIVEPDNLRSHQDAWLSGMRRLVDLLPEILDPEKGDERGYWQHELKAMEGMYRDLDNLDRTPLAFANTPVSWVISDSHREEFCSWGQSGPEWVSNIDNALHFSRRQDAEAVAAGDENSLYILPVGAIATDCNSFRRVGEQWLKPDDLKLPGETVRVGDMEKTIRAQRLLLEKCQTLLRGAGELASIPELSAFLVGELRASEVTRRLYLTNKLQPTIEQKPTTACQRCSRCNVGDFANCKNRGFLPDVKEAPLTNRLEEPTDRNLVRFVGAAKKALSVLQGEATSIEQSDIEELESLVSYFENREAAIPDAVEGVVDVRVSGYTGSGKSVIAYLINHYMARQGVEAVWVGGEAEINQRGEHALMEQLHQKPPKVRIVEVNVPRPKV